MKPKPNSDPSTKNPTPSGHSPASSNPYAPSVPISVYRELAAELQATKSMLDSMNSQNQQLLRHNQQLRQEIDRVVQSAMNLQQTAGSFQPSWGVSAEPQASTGQANSSGAIADSLRSQASRSAQRPPRPTAPAEDAPGVKPHFPEATPSSDELFTEQIDESWTRPQSQPKPPRDLSGLWLVLIIFVIIVTAFGTGFLVVRPFLQNQAR